MNKFETKISYRVKIPNVRCGYAICIYMYINFFISSQSYVLLASLIILQVFV